MKKSQICFDLELDVKENLDEIREAVARDYDKHGPFAIISGNFVRTGMSDNQIAKLCISITHRYIRLAKQLEKD